MTSCLCFRNIFPSKSKIRNPKEGEKETPPQQQPAKMTTPIAQQKVWSSDYPTTTHPGDPSNHYIMLDIRVCPRNDNKYSSARQKCNFENFGIRD
jgi:hypothetical protein